MRFVLEEMIFLKVPLIIFSRAALEVAQAFFVKRPFSPRATLSNFQTA